MKNMVLGNGPDLTEAELKRLEDAGVPLSLTDCRACTDPCEEHESYPSRFDVDMESPLLGSIKPFRRQIIISTGKSDWAREVTEVSNTLATHMLAVQERATSSSLPIKRASVPGVFHASVVEASADRVTILNGSHHTMDEDRKETVLIFPDYKLVSGVPATIEGAQDLWDTAADPSLGPAGKAGVAVEGLSSWVLPYGCVILLCSHRKRDNRCGIAAPLLEQEFLRVLLAHGWTAHTSLPNSSHELEPWLSLDQPSSDHITNSAQHTNGQDNDREEIVVSKLKHLLADEDLAKSALILQNSHVGGHKFVGNCIIYTPQGAGVWYGRVTPHDIEAIVSETVVGGKILPKLLRGGVNISRGSEGKCPKSLADW